MSNFQQALATTRLLRPPKRSLATFGTTTLQYVLLSTPGDQPGACRVREGTVTAERPQILTPGLWKERFEGFGADAEAYADHMHRLYGAALRALEYRFRNNLQSTTLEHAPFAELVDRVQTRLDREDALRTGLLQASDEHWSLAVMKFIVDTTLQSLPGNMRELQERGMFDPEAKADQRARMQIERLFAEATRDRSRINALGESLRASGLFSEYEDRFFALIKA